jgi:NADH-quinone oxidoreductase subunit D
LLDKNRIFLDRMRDVGVISADRAIAFGFTGPCLRSTGVDYDVRKAAPYMKYDRMDFEIPIGTQGRQLRSLSRPDGGDRAVARASSTSASKQIEPGPINVDDGRLVLPNKDEVYGSIEGTIAHFKIIMEGIKRAPR